MSLHTRRSVAAAFAAAVSLYACSTPAPPDRPSAPDPALVQEGDDGRDERSGSALQPNPGYVGEDDKIDPTRLKFASPAEAEAYAKLRTALARDEAPWVAFPLRRFGNFVNVEWCRGEGSEHNCAGGGRRGAPGHAWTSLEVLHYDKDWPQVFGLSFSLGEIPAEDGLGVSFSWSQGGKRVLGEHVGLQLFIVESGSVAGTMSFGMGQSFPIKDESVESPPQGGLSERARALRSSPDSLKRLALAELDALAKAVDEALRDDTITVCVYDEYKGDGIPPECMKRVPLNADEKADARRQLEARLRQQRQWVETHSEAAHSELMQLLPADAWSPPSD